MACQAIQMWSLSGLVGAFLDLAIAYLFLCVSAISFFASKFLELFGLCLPCPCNGLFFTTPNRNLCLQKLLIELPTEAVSNVQLSVKQKFPFNDSIWACNQHGYLSANNVKGFLELEGEASCSSVSDARRSGNVTRKLVNVRNDRFDMKGKEVMNYPRQGGLRRRRKEVIDYGRCSSVSSYDPSRCEEVGGGDAPLSPSSINRTENEMTRGGLLPADNGDVRNFEYDEKASTIMGFRQGIFDSVHYEDMHIKKNVSFVEELKGNAQGNLGLNGDENNAIRFLEQALEEEHAAGEALYLELEKERSAAATAADEAMAMILRLQEEKASIEMQARQYQRMIEEKSAYDAEEMNILKEILVRREREKHFLEKKVEMYRQMISPQNELADDNGEKYDPQLLFNSSIYSNEDPVLMLHKLSASIDKKVTLGNRGSEDAAYSDEQKCTVGNEDPVQGHYEIASFQGQEDLGRPSLRMSVCSSDSIVDLQEKEMISIDDNLHMPRNDPREIIFPEKTIPIEGKEQEQNENFNLGRKNIEIGNGIETGCPYDAPSFKQGWNAEHIGFYDSYNLNLDNDSHVYDVHVIGNGSNIDNEVKRLKSDQFSVIDASKVYRTNDLPFEPSIAKRIFAITDCPSTSDLHTEVDIKRSSSDITGGLPPMGPRGKSLLSDMRRSSMSVVDIERLKIDSEVVKLRERLRIVHEGRERLSLSVEHREREKVQMNLLEDIARQVQEIRQLTEPGKAVRQASLPPPSSKVAPKKRRCRSVSSGVRISS